MSERTESSASAALSVRNIGGIDTAAVEFSPGVNVLVGRNATNRTSLLQAVIGALGGSNVTLKGDAEDGETTLTLGDETYTRKLTRNEREVITSGQPLLGDTDIADLFAFLMESNEARRRVARMGDLRELIMSPVDTDEIEAEIRQLKRRQSEIEADIEEIDEEEQRLPQLIAERSSLEEELEQKRDELAEVQEKIADRDGPSESSEQLKDDLEEALDTKQRLKSTLEDVEFDLQTERGSLDSLQQEYDDLEAELAALPEVPDHRLQDVRSQLSQLRERRNALESTVNQMQNIIQFNDEQLSNEESLFGKLETQDGGLVDSLRSEASTDLLGALRTEYVGDQSITDQLVDDQQVLTCWTCGSQVKKTQIQEVIAELREIRTDQLDVLNDIESEIQDLTRTKEELAESARRHERISARLDELSAEIDMRHERIQELEARKADLEAEIETLSSEIDRLRTEIDSEEANDYSTALQLQNDAKQLEVELEHTEAERDDIATEIEAIEDQLERRGKLEAERAEIRDRLTDLRQRVERIEQRAVSEFNDRMADILDILEYSNIERIWIERLEADAGRTSETVFDIHVVRTTDDGRSYQDTIDHLSESEREVTGLVFALAGYLVHDVHESMPFMVLDSLEAIDSNRIARLVEYLSEYVEYLVVALLPEDAAALDEDCHYLSPPW